MGVNSAHFSDKRQTNVRNYTPILTPEQEAAKRRELEQRLYEVFRKYQQKPTL